MVNHGLIRTHFRQYDKDVTYDAFLGTTSGSINAAELTDLCYDLGYPVANEELMMQALDVDSSASVDFDKFSRWFESTPLCDSGESFECRYHRERIECYPSWLDWLIQAFKKYDVNRTGSISNDEFEQLRKDYPYNYPDAFKEFDANADGQVALIEFLKWVWANFNSMVGAAEGFC